MASYARPTELGDALALLAREAPPTLLAGGTDFYPARLGRPIDEDVLDLTAITALRGVREESDHWRLGALATWSAVIAAPLPPLFDGLKRAAREVGGVQVQNSGTLAGNLCNASPAADGTPNLIVLGAEVELASAKGTRRLPVDAFVIGSRRVARQPDEIVTAILVPKASPSARTTFLKLGARRYLVISIVMVAGLLETADGLVREARVAVGAASAVAQRLTSLEAELIGKPATTAISDLVTPAHLAALSPIDDVRASAAYRREAACELVRRVLRELV
jgi:CO/xanthine dehydrogenase FAD-binding subunit